MNTENIQTREDFIKFASDLRDDLIANKSKWQNRDLDTYLEALSRYAEDIEGYYKNNGIEMNPDVPHWRLFADIMVGASIYE